MKKRLGYGVIMIIVLLGLTMLAFNTQLCRAQLIGDLDEDGDVDIADLIIVAGAFGTTSIHPRWNAQADINDDAKVNMIDLQDLSVIAMSMFLMQKSLFHPHNNYFCSYHY